MPVWKLTPTDLSDPNWEASSHRGLAVMRAPDEAGARAAAAEAFDVPTRFPPTGGAKLPPGTAPRSSKRSASAIRVTRLKAHRNSRPYLLKIHGGGPGSSAAPISYNPFISLSCRSISSARSPKMIGSDRLSAAAIAWSQSSLA